MSPTALNNKHSSSAFKIVIPFLEFFINGILGRFCKQEVMVSSLRTQKPKSELWLHHRRGTDA